MAREAGAVRVIFVSCSPECIYPHIVSANTTSRPPEFLSIAIPAVLYWRAALLAHAEACVPFSNARPGGPAFALVPVPQAHIMLPVSFNERHANYVLSKYGIDLADPAGEDIQPTLILAPEANSLSRAPVPQPARYKRHCTNMLGARSGCTRKDAARNRSTHPRRRGDLPRSCRSEGVMH